MSVILLKFGLIALPFYELLVKLCPMAGVMSPNTRVAKSAVGLVFALAIGLSACFSGELKRCKNKWILLFLLFIPINVHLAPQYNIVLNGIQSPNYWTWKPFVMILCYFLMFLSVQSLNITKSALSGIFNVIVWCGVVMAGYVLLQNWGWDQFYNTRIGDEFIQVTKPITVGTLGNSTIVSPYIAMIIPFALYLRRYVVAAVLICAVIACQSEMAIGAVIVSLMAFACFRYRLKGVFAVFLALVLSLSVLNGIRVLNPPQFNKITSKVMQDNGRVGVWKETIRITKEEELGGTIKTRHPFTGSGLGSFSVIIRPLIKTRFAAVHNEYLEIFCTMGLVGLVLFLGAIFYMVKAGFIAYMAGFNRSELTALFSSFLCVCLVSFGSFPLQIAPIIYLTVLTVGLFSNQLLIKEKLA